MQSAFLATLDHHFPRLTVVVGARVIRHFNLTYLRKIVRALQNRHVLSIALRVVAAGKTDAYTEHLRLRKRFTQAPRQKAGTSRAPHLGRFTTQLVTDLEHKLHERVLGSRHVKTQVQKPRACTTVM